MAEDALTVAEAAGVALAMAVLAGVALAAVVAVVLADLADLAGVEALIEADTSGLALGDATEVAP